MLASSVLGAGPSIQEVLYWLVNEYILSISNLALPSPSQSPLWIGKTGFSGANKLGSLLWQTRGELFCFAVAGLGFFWCTCHPSKQKNVSWRRDGSRHCARLRAQAAGRKSGLSHLSRRFHQNEIIWYQEMSPTAEKTWINWQICLCLSPFSLHPMTAWDGWWTRVPGWCFGGWWCGIFNLHLAQAADCTGGRKAGPGWITLNRDGPGFPARLAWVCSVLTSDRGRVWCSGNSYHCK